MIKTIKIVPLLCGVFLGLSVIGCWYGFMVSTFVPASWMKWPSLIISVLICFLVLVSSNIYKVGKEKAPRLNFYFTILLAPFIFSFVVLISLTYALPDLAFKFSNIGDHYESQHLIINKSIRCSRECRYYLEIEKVKRIFISGIKIDKCSFNKIKIGDKVLVVGRKGSMGLKIEKILLK